MGEGEGAFVPSVVNIPFNHPSFHHWPPSSAFHTMDHRCDISYNFNFVLSASYFKSNRPNRPYGHQHVHFNLLSVLPNYRCAYFSAYDSVPITVCLNLSAYIRVPIRCLYLCSRY